MNFNVKAFFPTKCKMPKWYLQNCKYLSHWILELSYRRSRSQSSEVLKEVRTKSNGQISYASSPCWLKIFTVKIQKRSQHVRDLTCWANKTQGIITPLVCGKSALTLKLSRILYGYSYKHLYSEEWGRGINWAREFQASIVNTEKSNLKTDKQNAIQKL